MPRREMPRASSPLDRCRVSYQPMRADIRPKKQKQYKNVPRRGRAAPRRCPASACRWSPSTPAARSCAVGRGVGRGVVCWCWVRGGGKGATLRPRTTNPPWWWGGSIYRQAEEGITHAACDGWREGGRTFLSAVSARSTVCLKDSAVLTAVVGMEGGGGQNRKERIGGPSSQFSCGSVVLLP